MIKFAKKILHALPDSWQESFRYNILGDGFYLINVAQKEEERRILEETYRRVPWQVRARMARDNAQMSDLYLYEMENDFYSFKNFYEDKGFAGLKLFLMIAREYLCWLFLRRFSKDFNGIIWDVYITKGAGEIRRGERIDNRLPEYE